MKHQLASNVRCLLLILALWVGVCVGWAQQAAPPPPNQTDLRVFYMGKRSSAIEPCGCKTKQRGGLAYEAALYEQDAQIPSLRLDAGQWSSVYILNAPADSFRTRYLLRGLKMLDYDAVNVGMADVQQPRAYYQDIEKKHPGLLDFLISANIFLKDAPDQYAFQPYRIVTRSVAGGTSVTLGVTGVAQLQDFARPVRDSKTVLDKVETQDYLALPPADCLRKVVEELTPKVDMVFVLFDGDFEHAVELAKQVEGIQYLVITGNFPDRKIPMYREGNTRLLSVVNNQGKELGRMDMVYNSARNKLEPVKAPQSLYVSLDLSTNKALEGLVEECTQAIGKVEQDPKAEKIYAGAGRCVQCHHEEYNQWKETPHAHALNTLVVQGEQFNQGCLACHTTGFNQGNGFRHVMDSASRQMFGVQCEECHGPAKEHTEIEHGILTKAEKWMTKEQYGQLLERRKQVIPPKKISEQQCTQCHDAKNDPDFDFKVMLPKVDHRHAKKDQ